MPNAISHEKCSYNNMNDASIQIIGLFMMKCITNVCAIKKKTNIIKCDIGNYMLCNCGCLKSIGNKHILRMVVYYYAAMLRHSSSYIDKKHCTNTQVLLMLQRSCPTY